MHHHEKILHIDWAAGRDVRPDDLVEVQTRLSNWSVGYLYGHVRAIQC